MKRPWKSIRNCWNGMSIMGKVVWPQVIIVIVLIIVTFPILSRMTRLEVMNNMAESGYAYGSYAVSSLDTQLRQVRSVSNYLAESGTIQRFLGDEEANSDELLALIRNSLIPSEENKSIIGGIAVYAAENATEAARQAFALEEDMDLASSIPLSESAAPVQWRIAGNSSGLTLLLVRPLYYQRTQVGTLVIQTRDNLLVDLDTVFTSVIPGKYIILSDVNGLIYRSSGIAEQDVSRLMANASAEGYRYENQDIIYVINSSELRFRIVALQSIGRTVLNVYPGISVAVFGLLFLLLCILITIPLYLSLSRRIRRLAMHMSDTSSLTPACLAPVEGTDEIAQLTEAYNDLLLRMEKMAQDTQTAQMLQQNAAYDALQAQIKPHFLYNTLETLRMLAEGNQDEEVADMIYLLGKHLRSTISPGSKSTTISQEMENVQSYLQLFTLRMPNLSFAIRVDEDAGRVECPRFIVQPLVENAIKHGLKGSRAQALIDISARLENQRLLVEVRDNGVGIPDDRLEQVNARIREGVQENEAAITGSGLGLHNVHMRLKMFYGGESSVAFASDGSEGIICRMTIDLRKTEQKGR